MKKTFLTLVLMVMAIAVSAQSIKVGFNKGDVRKYETKSDFSLGIPMQGEKKASSDMKVTYTVTDVTADGYVVEAKADPISLTGDDDIASQFANSEVFGALEKTPAKLKLDKNGVVVDLINSDEVLGAVSALAIESINKTYAEHPEIEKTAPKAKALMAVNDMLTKEKVLSTITENTIFALNGKDFAKKPEADESLMDMIKTKSTYTVSGTDGNLVIAKKAVGNMSEDDIKALVKKQIKEMAGQDMSDADFNNVWAQMKMMGMARLDLDLNGTYNYGKGGWLSSSNSKTTVKLGVTIKVSSSTNLVD